MFIVGHRGAAGVEKENSMSSLRNGKAANVDMIEFDVRLTKDNIPVLLHDGNLSRTHKISMNINQLTYRELQSRTKGTVNPIATIKEVLEEFSGRVLLYFDIKEKGCARALMPIMRPYIKNNEDWEQFLFCSNINSELKELRTKNKYIQLGLVHWYNPLKFLVINKQLNLTSVSFHRLHVNTFTISAAKKLGLFVFAYTVNRPDAAERLERQGVDGIVTDYPEMMVKHFAKLDAND